MKKIIGILKRSPKTILNNILRVILPNYSNPLEFLKVKDNLELNIKFKDKYKGQRCFILGSGPSISKQDLLNLKGENIFVVNSFPNTGLYDSLEPQFFVSWDEINFNWEDSEIGKDRYELFKKISEKNPKTTYILPIRELKRIQESTIIKEEQTLFSYWGLNWKRYKKRNFDFEKQLPFVNNVIDLSIMAAMYMGFNEIYLLGVDMTDFLSKYEYSWNKEINEKYGHFYKYSQSERKIIDKVADLESSNEERLIGTAEKLKVFRLINEIAKKSSIKIINLTEGGGLDVFPRMRYEEIVKKL